MKKIVFPLIAISLLTAPAAARTSVQASDSRITYIGRTLQQDGSVSFDWSSTYARISFQGDYLAVRASDSGKDYFNVWIDRDMSADADKVLSLSSRDSLLVLFDANDLRKGRRNRPHTVIIQKRTEAQQGRATFIGFETDGTLLQAPAPKERLIEFIGDSYTCGYGIENSISRNRYTPETQNTS